MVMSGAEHILYLPAAGVLALRRARCHCKKRNLVEMEKFWQISETKLWVTTFSETLHNTFPLPLLLPVRGYNPRITRIIFLNFTYDMRRW